MAESLRTYRANTFKRFLDLDQAENNSLDLHSIFGESPTFWSAQENREMTNGFMSPAGVDPDPEKPNNTEAQRTSRRG